jgi:outer membrane protein
MKPNKQRDNVGLFIAAIVLLLLVVLLNGCVDEESFYQDVRSSRTVAYNDWVRVQKQEQEQNSQISGKLSMQDALKLAMLNNNELMAVVQQREVAKGKVVESYSEVLPSVTGVAGYRRLDKVSSFEVNGNSISLGEVDNYSADLVVRQPLYRGGAISAALRAARLYELYSDEQVRAQLQKTIYEVAVSYFDTLLAQQLYKVNEEAVNSAQAQLDDVQAKRGQGMASEFDILRAQVDVSNFRAEMIQQKNRISIAKTKLLKAMGVIQSGQLELADDLRYENTPPELMGSVKTAYQNRADLYLAEYELRLQKESVTVAQSEYWPQAYGLFTQGWSRPDPHTQMLDQWGHFWTTGVVLEWPLFSGLGREGRIIQERAIYRQKQYLLKNTEQKVFLEVQQAVLNYQDAEEFVDSQKLNLNRATEGLRLAEVGYREGVNTRVELTDARSALTRASGLYYQSLYQHTLARLNLQFATGVLGPNAGQKQDAVNIVRPASLNPNNVVPDPNLSVQPMEKQS